MVQPDTILLADDHPLFRQAVAGVLQQQFTGLMVREADSAKALECVLAQSPLPDLLLDLNIPGAHGFNTLMHIRQTFPALPVAVSFLIPVRGPAVAV
ncbi:response regulator [Ferrimonas pelagia]|uniref:Response regulatory domain-containing protein n=1 Tax=Ferrimonas pelagia TaxID=1177826 RepID=A0ABP9EER0_9GAMM